MPSLILPQPFHKLLIIGPIYDKINKLPHIEKMLSSYDYIIFNGGLGASSDNIQEIKIRINKMQELITTNKIIYIAGRTDYLLQDNEITQWIIGLPNIVIADFPTHSVLITDGGISQNIRHRKNLDNNLEISFISHIENKPWHQSYNGNLGYVISNNPLTNKKPQHYRYSMQLGNIYDGEVYAQEIDEIGLKQTILL